MHRVMHPEGSTTFMVQIIDEYDRRWMIDLMRCLLEDDLLRHHQARLFWSVESGCTYIDNEEKKVMPEPNCMVVVFHTAEGAMAFKLAYVDGDQFIPWRDR